MLGSHRRSTFGAVDDDTAWSVDITKYVNVSASSVRSILGKLKDQNVVTTRRGGKTPYYRLNIEGMRAIVQQQRKREQIGELKERVRE